MKKIKLSFLAVAFFAICSAFAFKSNANDDEQYGKLEGDHFVLITPEMNWGCISGSTYCLYKVKDGVTNPDLNDPNDFEPENPSEGNREFIINE